MINKNQNTDFYFIGDVVKKLGLHEQTIREYERRKLIKPQRGDNQIRLFTETDITRIELIITLTQEMGLNLNGVRLALLLSKKLSWEEEELLDFIEEHKHEIILRSTEPKQSEG